MLSLLVLVRCSSRISTLSASISALQAGRHVVRSSALLAATTRSSMSGSVNRGQNGFGEGGDSPADQRLVWIDAEMTGLDVDTCHLLEVACLITDGQLTIIAEGPNIVINQPDEILNSMNDWCKKQHGLSGLTEQVRASRVSLQAAEYELLSFVRAHTPPGRCALAGNSVHADKRFLDKYMPTLMQHLHYRIVDVSSIKELCRRWYPADYQKVPAKACTHRALDDIKESIAELKYYRRTIFKPDS